MKKLVLAATTALATLAMAGSANAIQLTAFGQTSGSNTVTATANVGLTATHIAVTNATVGITQILGGIPVNARFTLSADSTDAATLVAGAVVLQHYAGSFCLTSAVGCGGINYLSGNFSDAVVGKAGGPGIVVNVNSPPDTLALTSSVINVANLASPNTFNLSFSNVGPLVGICGTTICAFRASFSGTSSGVGVPEPASLAVMGMGLLGFGFFFRRKRSSPQA